LRRLLFNRIFRKYLFTVAQEEANRLGEFLHKKRYKVLILRKYGVSYNPEDKTLEVSHYPIQVYDLYGYLHYEQF